MEISSFKKARFVLGGIAIILSLVIAALSQIKATYESKALSFDALYNYLGQDINSGGSLISEANALNRDLATWQSLTFIIKSHGADKESVEQKELVAQMEENMTILSDEMINKRKRACKHTEKLLKLQVNDVTFEETSSINCNINSASLDQLTEAADANMIAAKKLAHRIGKQSQKESRTSTIIGKWITFIAIAAGIISSLLSYILISDGKT